MNPGQFLLIIRAHYKVALFVALIAIMATLAVSLLLPKRYTATTAMLVDVKSPDPVAAMAMMMPASLSTQVDIINSERVARRVVRTMGLTENLAVRDDWQKATGGKGSVEVWLANLLMRGLAVQPSRDSNIINISYTGTDPAFTAAVVNAYAQSYIDVTIELKVEPARQYARWFGDQGKILRDNLEKAQSKLSEFQQEKGIVSREEQMDVETAKLTDLTTQLLKVQSETNDANSKLKARAAGDTLPEVSSDGVVSGLRGEIIKMEAKLQETGLNLGKNHPQYLRMQSEIESLKQKLEVETARVTSGFSASKNVGTDRGAVLRGLVEAQKKKLLEIRTSRDQLAVLQRDVDAAKNAYDAVSKRYMDTDLASQSTQANVTVLTPALVPLEPSFPKPLDKTMLAAVGIGIFLGVAAAFVLEMFDRRVRSVTDLAEILPLPVLGVITRARPPGRLLAMWRRRPALLTR